MTYEQWWWEFIAAHEEWRYADSDALRKAAFAAGAASVKPEVALVEAYRCGEESRDAEIAELVAALEECKKLNNMDKPISCAETVDETLAKVRKPT